MNSPRILLTVGFALATAGLFAQTPAAQTSPKDVLAQITALRKEAQEKQKRGEDVSEPALQKQIEQIALSATNGVDPEKVASPDAMDWLTVFQLAKKDAEVNVLASRAYSYKSFELMQLDSYVVRDLIEKGQLAEAARHVRDTAFGFGPSMVGQLHLGIRGPLEAQAPKHLSEVLAVYDALVDRVHYNAPLTDNDRNWGPVVYASLMSDRYSLLYQAGQKDAALKGLNALVKEMARHPQSKDAYAQTAESYVQKAITRLTSPDRQGALFGKAAPAVVSDRHLGDFTSFANLKGKVVVLDFMAHWCGPCKAALPELVKLQDRLGSKGLQILSLTGYYGYFGARQGIGKDDEFNAMKGFVKDFNISWPVLFDGTGANNGNYGVSAIPQLVVIDRKGVVRKVEIGFSAESFAKTIQLIDSLLSEPVK